MDFALLKHAGFCFQGEKIVYFDPFRITSERKDADVVFISHEHFDHCDPPSLKNVICEKTTIVCPPDCVSRLRGLQFKEVFPVEPGQLRTIVGIPVQTVPAYNVNKFRAPGQPFHPHENGWVGYIVTLQGKRVYHTGDTDIIPEFKSIQNIDLALVPVSGTYVMTPEEAATAVQMFKPKIAVPMHYDEIVGTVADAEKFKRLLEGKVNVQILQPRG